MLSSAPKVEEHIVPEPTPTDPYPGYYQLPSGSWAQYDPEYYQKFCRKWKNDYDAQVRALEKGVEKGFEGAEDGATAEVNAQAEMENARRMAVELDAKKQLTAEGDDSSKRPRMNIQVFWSRSLATALFNDVI